MKRKVLIGLSLLAIVAVAIALWPRAKHFFDVDSCLDSGGAYDYKLGQCYFGEEAV